MLDLINKAAIPIIVFMNGIFLIYFNYKKNTNTIDDRLITNYKALDEQQKSQLAEKDERIKKYENDMTEVKLTMTNLKENFAKEIGKLQGQIDAKDKELASLRATVLDPTLDLGKILREIHGFMEALTKSNIHQVNILEKQVEDEAIIAERDKNLIRGRTN